MATQEQSLPTDEIEETFGMVPPPLKDISDTDMANEWPIFKRFTVEETEIPAKYRELIGLAVAANIKCPYCTHFHRHAAQLHGAKEAELTETFVLASFTSRYSAMLHAMEYDLDQFTDEVADIGDHLQHMMAEADD